MIIKQSLIPTIPNSVNNINAYKRNFFLNSNSSIYIYIYMKWKKYKKYSSHDSRNNRVSTKLKYQNKITKRPKTIRIQFQNIQVGQPHNYLPMQYK
jgi:hypothetical protein